MICIGAGLTAHQGLAYILAVVCNVVISVSIQDHGQFCTMHGSQMHINSEGVPGTPPSSPPQGDPELGVGRAPQPLVEIRDVAGAELTEADGVRWCRRWSE